MKSSDVIHRYCQVWSEPDPISRAQLLASVWSAGATYTDPGVHAAGAEALLAHIAKIQAGRPGARVVRTMSVDEHHGVARFGFRVLAADGTILREGMDIAFIAADGATIDRIVGFFGSLVQSER